MKMGWISIGLTGVILAIGLLLGMLVMSWQPAQEAQAQKLFCNTAKAKDPYLKDLAFKEVGGVKEAELEIKDTDWDLVVASKDWKGAKVKAWTYNGTLPGPVIRVQQGDKVRIKVKNSLPAALPPYAKERGARSTNTTIHWHGVHVPNAMDGVPGVNQAEIKPGETFVYEFEITQGPGTFFYHTHVDVEAQVDLGLFGPFVIEPKTGAQPCDREYIIMTGTNAGHFTIGGRAFPSTGNLKVKKGEKILLRFIDATSTETVHSMHTHGHEFKVIAKDGVPFDGAVMDTLPIMSGERYDAVVEAKADPGLWAFHCHILPHAANPDRATEFLGMGGLVTLIEYEK